MNAKDILITISQLESKERLIRAKLYGIIDNIKRERIDLAWVEYDVKIGSIVKSTRSGKKYHVTDITPDGNEGRRPTLEGVDVDAIRVRRQVRIVWPWEVLVKSPRAIRIDLDEEHHADS